MGNGIGSKKLLFNRLSCFMITKQSQMHHDMNALKHREEVDWIAVHILSNVNVRSF